jgi:hypothetical protein
VRAWGTGTGSGEEMLTSHTRGIPHTPDGHQEDWQFIVELLLEKEGKKGAAGAALPVAGKAAPSGTTKAPVAKA